MPETAFDRAVGVMFDNEDMARWAVYTRPDEWHSPVAVRVLPGVLEPEALAMRSRRNLTAFEVRVADLPEPVENGHLEIDCVLYRIQSRPAHADDERLTWRLECYEVPA